MFESSIPQTTPQADAILPLEERIVHVGSHRITHLRPRRDVADLSFDASWPPHLQHLWQSCNSAYVTFVELGEVLRDHPRDEALAALEIAAYHNWSSIESYSLPLFVAFDATLFR